MLDAACIQTQGICVGMASHSHQHLLRHETDRLVVLAPAHDLCARRISRHRLNRALQIKLDPHFFHVGNADFGQIAVQHGQHMVHGFHYGHLSAESSVGAGQLQADDAAADDHHGLGQFFQAQRTGGIDAVGIILDAGDGRHGVRGAGGQNICVRIQRLLGAVVFQNAHVLGAQEIRFTVDFFDLVGFQQACDSAGQLFGDLIFVLNDLGEIYPNIGCLDADRLSLLLDIRQKLCAVEQWECSRYSGRFRRDAPFPPALRLPPTGQPGWRRHSRRDRLQQQQFS